MAILSGLDETTGLERPLRTSAAGELKTAQAGVQTDLESLLVGLTREVRALRKVFCEAFAQPFLTPAGDPDFTP